MPELPEVEIIRRGIEQKLLHHPKITHVTINNFSLRKKIPRGLKQKILGQSLHSVRRRAKYLIFELSDDLLVSHLGMTGTWRENNSHPLLKHDHLILRLSTGVELVFNDPRRFGLIDLISKNQEHQCSYLKDLGPEPLSSDFNTTYLGGKAKRRESPIKTFIMNQKIVVGVGNIYASESLFRAQIKPSRKTKSLSPTELEKLCNAIKIVLTEAIAAGGSSISDFKQFDGESGYFQHHFQVYEREREACVICKTPIRRKVIGGRSSYWCPKCQH